jgi:DNA-directed RNA polymerase II subunit RPB1
LLAFYRDFAGTEDAPNSAASCPWVLRFEFDRMKMLNLQVTMLDLEYALVDHFDDAVTAVLSDDNADRLVCRLRLNALADIDESTDLLTEMKAMEQAVMDQLVIKGVRGIDKAVPLKPSSGLKKYDPVSDAYVMDDEWYIETAGTNLMEVLCHPCVDYTRTYTNDIYEIYQVLGIEAARQAVIDEMRAVLDSTPIDHRHLSLLADTMSNRGFFMSIDRHGINNRGELGPLAKASFEQSTDMLIKAGVFSERDRINGVSANIMLGQVAPCGTGDCSVLMDNETLVALGKPVRNSMAKAPQASVVELPELEAEAEAEAEVAVDKKKAVRRKKVDEIKIV